MVNLDILDSLGALLESLEADNFLLQLFDDYADGLTTYPPDVAECARSAVLDSLSEHVRTLGSVYDSLVRAACSNVPAA